MPADQVMCAHCWAKVPIDLRRKLDNLHRDAAAKRRDLQRQAIAAAQGMPT
jgi:hypothetical protein